MFPPDKMQISFRKNLFTGLPGLGEFEQKQRGLCSTIDQACRDGEIFRKEMWDSNDGKKEVGPKYFKGNPAKKLPIRKPYLLKMKGAYSGSDCRKS